MDNPKTPEQATLVQEPLKHDQTWSLHQPRIAMRIGLIGSDAAVSKVLSISSDGPPRPLDRLFEALRSTLTEVIERDAKLDWPDSNLIPKTAIVTWATQWFGYRVDKASLKGQKTSVYDSRPPLLRLRTLAGSLESILRKWQKDTKEVDTEIDTIRIAGIKPTPDPTREESFAYTLLLHHSDLLVAVWDTDDIAQRSQIDGMIRKAIRERMDVVAIRLCSSGAPLVAILDTERELDLLHRGETATALVLQSIAANEKLSSEDFTTLEKQWFPTYEFPDASINDRENHIVSGAYLYHPRAAFLKLVRNEPPRITIAATQFWNRYKRLTQALGRRHHNNHSSDHSPKSGSPPVAVPKAIWSKRVAKVQGVSDDPFGKRHGESYRGGIVASYVLAIFAVILAGLGGWLHMGHTSSGHSDPVAAATTMADHPHQEDHAQDDHPQATQKGHGADHPLSGEHGSDHGTGAIWLPIVFGLLELGIVLWMFMLSLWSSKRGWRIQFTESRMLAEAMRIWQVLGTMGLHTPMPNLPHYLRGDYVAPNAEATWSLWYFRALVREAPIYLDPEDEKRSYATQAETLKFLASDQIEYHSANSHQQHYNHELIEKLSTFLFLAVLACVGWHLLELVSGVNLYASYGIVICIGGPFLIALLHGFESQLEIQRLRQRSSSVEKLLCNRLREVEDLQSRPGDTEAITIEDRWHLLREGLEIGSILIDETAGWSMLYRARDIHAG